ncbi:response regulator transcription factor [Micromonospora sp. NBC_01796]|uniref:response regulator transcription factor n=1 Tax=Micromonospora sp. NBC_01796 TaxID=2975987 RepID=UPI002DDB9405|nr:helix-turn-helix transcriptional regulator [Micromonospora sp. NBC_01796]WSA87684.1 helix-turn-helix transcriptional regulator [Micromonospora sp. NBC_01796]
MRTVLVCVRTPLAAQSVASAAARLGLAAVVRTAISDPEVMLRLAERPADVLLVDTALTRPDSVGFTRRVLARAPGAAILLLGAEEPGVAAAVIAAGGRGLLPGGDHDLVSVVAKAMLLLSTPGRGGRGTGLTGAGGSTGAPLPAEVAGAAGRATAERLSGAASRLPARPGAVPGGSGPVVTGPALGSDHGGRADAADDTGGANPQTGPTVVPVQRGDDVPGEHRAPADGDGPPADGSDARTNTPPDNRFTGPRRGDPANTGGYGRPAAAAAGPGATGPLRRAALTERELQVLLGMADGKSNAEIGRELFVSEDTVKTHARRLFRKLGARDRAHAVAAGFRAGLVA